MKLSDFDFQLPDELIAQTSALRAYAEGVNAYLDGLMDEALDLLTRWLEGPAPGP